MKATNTPFIGPDGAPAPGTPENLVVDDSIVSGVSGMKLGDESLADPSKAPGSPV